MANQEEDTEDKERDGVDEALGAVRPPSIFKCTSLNAGKKSVAERFCFPIHLALRVTGPRHWNFNDLKTVRERCVSVRVLQDRGRTGRLRLGGNMEEDTILHMESCTPSAATMKDVRIGAVLDETDGGRGNVRYFSRRLPRPVGAGDSQSPIRDGNADVPLKRPPCQRGRGEEREREECSFHFRCAFGGLFAMMNDE